MCSYGRQMQWLSTVAVCVSGASVLATGIGVARSNKTARTNVKDTLDHATAERREDQRANAYLELLKSLQEDEVRVEAEIHNFQRLFADPHDREPRRSVGEPMVNRTTVRALAAGFTSALIKELYDQYWTNLLATEWEIQNIVYQINENHPDWTENAIDDDRLVQDLVITLEPARAAAQKALEEAIAAELGHRGAV